MSSTLQTVLVVLVLVVIIGIIVSLVISILPFVIIGVVMIIVYQWFKRTVLNKKTTQPTENQSKNETISTKAEDEEVTDVSFQKK